MRAAVLTPAFHACEREVLHADLATSRRPRRAIVLVNDILDQRRQKIVEAFVPQWNPHEAVGFPLELVPADLRPKVQPGTTLLASVNIDAESSADLFFGEFELPHPSDLQDEPS